MIDIRTGVIKANDIHGDAFYDTINLGYEQALLNGYENDELDFISAEDVLIGFIQCSADDPYAYLSLASDNGCAEIVFKADMSASFSAIVSINSNVAQIVRSKYVKGCGYCSPCYPGQGDLNTEGNVLSYAVPPEYMCEECKTSGIVLLSDYEKTI